MSKTHYTGTDLLQILSDVHRYNAALVRHVTSVVSPEDELLDFGAGIGTFSELFKKRGYRVCAVERDAALLERLRERGTRGWADIGEVPSGHFRAAYTFNVLEHIEDDVGALRGLRRALSPGGRLVVYVPALSWLWTSLDDKVGHYRRYKKAELRAKLEEVGFRNVEVAYADCLGVPASLAYRLLDPGDGRVGRREALFYDRWFFPLSRTLDKAARHFIGKNLVAVAQK